MRNGKGAAGPSSPRFRRRAFFTGQKVLGACRVGDLYGARRGAAHAVVLMYHSVCPPEHEPWVAPRNRISPMVFEKQLRRLAATGRVISLSRLAAADGPPPAPGSIVLTFDDGYLDNLDVAAPLLRKYGLPATLYLATGYVANAEPQWADLLYSAIRHRVRDRLSLDGIGAFDLGARDQRHAALHVIGRHMIEASRERRTELLDTIREQAGSPRCSVRLTMDFDDVRRVMDDYRAFELGVHTADHLDLSAMDTGDAIREVQRSVDDFRRELDRDAEHFSFPYSRWTPAIRGRLGATGLRTAMTGQGVVALDELDPFDLRRLEAPVSMPLFRYWTSGAHPVLTRRVFGRH